MYSISAQLICNFNNNKAHFFDLWILVWAGLDYSLECEAVELFGWVMRAFELDENAHSRI